MIALDTNILVYAIDRGDPERMAQAVRLLGRCASANAVVPLQVMAEFFNACRKRRKLSQADARLRVEAWTAVFNVPLTRSADLIDGSRASERYDLQFFDALICAVSRAAGATVLLSEDMHDGLNMDGLVVLNPFNPANDARIEAALG